MQRVAFLRQSSENVRQQVPRIQDTLEHNGASLQVLHADDVASSGASDSEDCSSDDSSDDDEGIPTPTTFAGVNRDALLVREACGAC